jgi:hypothetical protein
VLSRSLTRRSLFRSTVLAVAAALAVAACASPTLPLPPPSRPNVAGPDGTGTVSLSGTIPSKAQAFAVNTRTSVIAGQQTGDDGHFNFGLKAQVGDEVGFWYQSGTLDSQTVYFIIQPPEEPAGTGGAATGGAASGDPGGGGGEGGAY